MVVGQFQIIHKFWHCDLCVLNFMPLCLGFKHKGTKQRTQRTQRFSKYPTTLLMGFLIQELFCDQIRRIDIVSFKFYGVALYTDDKLLISLAI